MVPIAIDGPAVEPVSIAEMRAYLRLDDGAEDELVAALVKARGCSSRPRPGASWWSSAGACVSTAGRCAAS